MIELQITEEELLAGLMAVATLGFVLGWLANLRKKEVPDE